MRQDFKERLETCSAFEEGKPSGGNCMTDGHYICQECKHIDRRMIGGQTAYDEAARIIDEDARQLWQADLHQKRMELEEKKLRSASASPTADEPSPQ